MQSASLTRVIDRLPHTAPFRFLTTIEELIPKERGRGTWLVSGAEDFFRGHFPGEPVVPGVLIGEALAQLAGLVGLHTDADNGTSPRRSGRLVHIDVRFDHPVIPPASITLEAVLARELGTLRQFDVSAEVKGVTAARGSLTLSEVREETAT